MAYKVFQNGYPLPASELNNYLMNQAVVVFANASARATDIPAPVEGMLTYLENLDKYEFYNGTAWVDLNDNTDAIPKSIIDAAGDLIVGSAADTSVRLPIGTIGQLLTSDGSTAVWSDNSSIPKAIVDAAGDLITATSDNTPSRLAIGSAGTVLTSTGSAASWTVPTVGEGNAIINGAFEINQRGFTSVTTDGTYTYDRWGLSKSGGTVTASAQTFTPGSAPVSGYEASNYLRVTTSGQTSQSQYAAIYQGIENVRNFAGQTITISFWAKADTGTPYVWVEYQQNFGSGGSSFVLAQAGSTLTLSTSWTRYSVTATLPSISGKTVGTNSQLSLNIFTSLGSSVRSYPNATYQNTAIDIWGVQLEAGSNATPFKRNGTSLQAELAASQRYYYRANTTYMRQYNNSGALCNLPMSHPVTMRTTPSYSVITAPGYVNASGFQAYTTNPYNMNFQFNITSTGTGFVDQTGVFEMSAEF